MKHIDLFFLINYEISAYERFCGPIVERKRGLGF